MSSKMWRLLLAAELAFLGCDSHATKSESEGPPPGPASTAMSFGAPIPPGTTTPFAAVLAKPDEYSDKPVVVEATVRRVCHRRGCWMELGVDGGPSGQGCRVTFRDYGFFVPTDSTGAHARVQGVVKTRRLPPAEVTHMEQEGAHFAARSPDGSAREVRIVATGVELTRPAS